MTALSTINADRLSSPEVISDPYPYYRELREHSPLNYVVFPAGAVSGIDKPIRAWALMKYRDVYNALRDHGTFASGRNPLAGKIAPKLALIQDDPPRHTRFRRIVNKTFSQKRIDALLPWIQTVTNELLDEMGTGEKDVVPSFTIPLPIKVIARLLGIPGEDYFTLKRWSDAFIAFSTMAPEERAKSNHEMATYFGRMAAARRHHGADDLITALVEAEVDGESLDDGEILGFCMLLLIAGNETTTNLIGNMLGILAERPEIWRRLREDRSLVSEVIEETLRFDSPIQRLPRHTTRPIEISGIMIPEGSTISIYYGAANRDPDEFPNPDEFRLDRRLQNHVAFGAGIHYCLGAPLARAEAAIALNTLLDRFPVIEPGSAPARRQSASLMVYGYERLPIRLCKG